MEKRKVWSFGDDVKSRNSQLQKLLGLCAVKEMVVQNIPSTKLHTFVSTPARERASDSS